VGGSLADGYPMRVTLVHPCSGLAEGDVRCFDSSVVEEAVDNLHG
jgi:hypothetical protein